MNALQSIRNNIIDNTAIREACKQLDEASLGEWTDPSSAQFNRDKVARVAAHIRVAILACNKFISTVCELASEHRVDKVRMGETSIPITQFIEMNTSTAGKVVEELERELIKLDNCLAIDTKRLLIKSAVKAGDIALITALALIILSTLGLTLNSILVPILGAVLIGALNFTVVAHFKAYRMHPTPYEPISKK